MSSATTATVTRPAAAAKSATLPAAATGPTSSSSATAAASSSSSASHQPHRRKSRIKSFISRMTPKPVRKRPNAVGTSSASDAAGEKSAVNGTFPAPVTKSLPKVGQVAPITHSSSNGTASSSVITRSNAAAVVPPNKTVGIGDAAPNATSAIKDATMDKKERDEQVFEAAAEEKDGHTSDGNEGSPPPAPTRIKRQQQQQHKSPQGEDEEDAANEDKEENKDIKVEVVEASAKPGSVDLADLERLVLRPSGDDEGDSSLHKSRRGDHGHKEEDFEGTCRVLKELVVAHEKRIRALETMAKADHDHDGANANTVGMAAASACCVSAATFAALTIWLVKK